MIDLSIHPAARMEYETAADWYAVSSSAAADRFAAEVEAGIKAIRKSPNSFSRLDETHRIYLFDKFPYYIAYRQKAKAVEIVAIRHAARDQDAWKIR